MGGGHCCSDRCCLNWVPCCCCCGGGAADKMGVVGFHGCLDCPPVLAEVWAHLQARQQGCLTLGTLIRQGPDIVAGVMP